jgi:hypothetical protein
VALPGQRTTVETTHDIEPGFKVITIRLYITLVRLYAGIFIDGIPLRIRDMRLLYHILLRMAQIYNTDLGAELSQAYVQIFWCNSAADIAFCVEVFEIADDLVGKEKDCL